MHEASCVFVSSVVSRRYALLVTMPMWSGGAPGRGLGFLFHGETAHRHGKTSKKEFFHRFPMNLSKKNRVKHKNPLFSFESCRTGVYILINVLCVGVGRVFFLLDGWC